MPHNTSTAWPLRRSQAISTDSNDERTFAVAGRGARARRAGREAAQRPGHVSDEPQRARRRLQPEDEPRADHERDRRRRAAGARRAERLLADHRDAAAAASCATPTTPSACSRCRRNRSRCSSTLVLRGPQTAGELRTNSERLHRFGDISAVEGFLHELAERAAGPLVAELPRLPGTRETRWTQLLTGAPPASTSRRRSRPGDRMRAASRSSRRSSTRCATKSRR